MAKKRIKDTDYLAISARIRALETGLMTKEDYDQLITARTTEDAEKLLSTFGYEGLDPTIPEGMDAALTLERAELFEEMGDAAPDARYLDIFKIKYDYHNIKVLLKAEATGAEAGHMLADLGRVRVEELFEAMREKRAHELPGLLGAAEAEAREVLSTTRDPQLADAVLDRWYFADLLQAADETGSEFLKGYVRTQIDGANLRTLVRTLRMGKNTEFLRGVLFPGGDMAEEELLRVSAAGGNGLAELYATTPFAAAAAAGAEALGGGTLTEFEKRCDDAVDGYLEGSQLVPFGEAPLVSYLAYRETEYTNLRIVLMGRMLGLEPDVIRARLRTGYR